eukprot:14748417-Alexandrium_andersonii.AAC.1
MTGRASSKPLDGMHSSRCPAPKFQGEEGAFLKMLMTAIAKAVGVEQFIPLGQQRSPRPRVRRPGMLDCGGQRARRASRGRWKDQAPQAPRGCR